MKCYELSMYTLYTYYTYTSHLCTDMCKHVQRVFIYRFLNQHLMIVWTRTAYP